MAVLGEAHIVVKAITDNFRKELKDGVRKAAPDMEQEGNGLRRSFDRGFARGGGIDRNQIFTRDFFERAERARIAFRNFNRAFTLLFPAIVGVGGAIGALGGGLITLIALLGNAARSSIVLVAALGALGQAGIAGALAVRGVGDALRAGLQAQDGATGRARNEEAALRRLRDARIALRNLIEREKPEALARAREQAADAADSAADAVLNAERAERSYFEAQREAIKAVEDLAAARDRAREKLQQLRFEVEGAAISEKRARIEFERAREALQRVQDLPPNSRARQEAELAFAEADLNLRRAIDRNADLKIEEEKATRAGIEGSQEVIDAKERVRRAQQSEADAAIDAARAFRDAAKAQQRAAQAAADAAAGGRVEREFDERIARAREAVIDAERALADAAAGGVNRFAEALSKLSPAAQAFVKTILENEKAFKALQLATQEAFFLRFNAALDLLIPRLPQLTKLFEETGDILGKLALGFVELFLSAKNYGRTERIWKTNNRLLDNLGQTFNNLIDGLLLLLDAAEPVIDAFGKWALESSSGWVERLRGNFDGVRESIERSADKAARLFAVFGTLKQIFGELGKAINEDGGAADVLLGWLKKITDEGLASLQNFGKGGGQSLKDFFVNLTESAILVLEIIGKIITGLLVLGAQPGTKQFLTSLRDTIDGLKGFAEKFGEEDGPLASIGKFIQEFFTTLGLLLQNESFTVFIGTLTDALKGLNEFLRQDSTQAFLQGIAPILAYVLALGFIGSVISGLFRVVAGFFALLLGGPKNASRIFDDLFKKISVGGPAALGPFISGFLRILGIVGLVITAIALMWENSESFRTSITGLFSAIGEIFKGVSNDLGQIFAEGTELAEFWQVTFANLGDIIAVVIGVVAGAIGFIVGLISGAIQSFAQGIMGIYNFFAGLVDIFRAVMAFFRGESDLAAEYLKRGWEGVVNGIKGYLFGLMNFFIAIANGVIDAWNGFARKFVVPNWEIFGRFAGQGLPTYDRLRPLVLARGGVIPATPGGSLAIIGEAGRSERVEPLDPDGLSKRDKAMIEMLTGGMGGGPVINVYPAPGMDEQELAEKVSRELAFQMRRGGV